MTGFTCRQDQRGVATLTLDRPHIHNAFDDTMINGLTQTLRHLADDPSVRALVLAANGRSFSAGADLDWMRRMAGFSYEENARDAAGLAALMVALDTFPRPTIAKVQGSAYGGGVGLVACCDIAVAVPKVLFCLSEVRIGLIPAVISPYVVNAIGQSQTRRYFQTAEVFSAQRAYEIGLVHELADEGTIDDKVEDLLASILKGAPGAQREAKDLIFLCEAGAEGLTRETAHRIAIRRASPEGRAGVQAFLAKTSPPWL